MAGRQLPTEADGKKPRAARTGAFILGQRCTQQYLVELQFKRWRYTAVDSYPRGASPYGVLDMLAMSGNGWQTGIKVTIMPRLAIMLPTLKVRQR